MSIQLFGAGTEEHARYAKVILRDTTVLKTPELLWDLHKMTENVFGCDVRRGNRTREQVFSSVKKTVMDRALCDVTGFRWNSADFDVTNPATYAYDAEDTQKGKLFEVKSLKEKWLSWRGEKPMRTFLKFKDSIDYLVSGKMWESESDFRVSFLLLARAQTFDKFIKPSMTSGTNYYHHKIAGQQEQAIYRKEIN